MRIFFKTPFFLGLLGVAILLLFFGIAATSVLKSSAEISYHQSYEAGEEIIIRFTSWVSGDKAKEAFSIAPVVEGQLVWQEEYKELHFVPHLGFNPATNYRVKISNYTPIFAGISSRSKTFAFETKPAVSSPPQKFEKPKILKGKYIDVNLAVMVLTLFENGNAVKSFHASGKGNPSTSPTRQGTFRVESKEENHLSTISHVWMP